jgi:hypothetical protein
LASSLHSWDYWRIQCWAKTMGMVFVVLLNRAYWQRWHNIHKNRILYKSWSLVIL